MRGAFFSQTGTSSMMILIMVALMLFIYWEASSFVKQYQLTGLGSAPAPHSPSSPSPAGTNKDVEVFRWIDDGKP